MMGERQRLTSEQQKRRLHVLFPDVSGELSGGAADISGELSGGAVELHDAAFRR